MRVEAQLILYYNNYLYNSYDRSRLYVDDGMEKKTLVKSIINPNTEYDFIKIYEGIDRSENTGHLDMIHFMRKIDLTTNIQL